MLRSPALDHVMALAAEQGGMVTRAQVLRIGLRPDQLRAEVDARRWRRLWPGTFATFTGPVPPLGRAWAACLHAGPQAVLAGSTALWLAGALDELPSPVRVCVPHDRRVLAVPGVVITRSRTPALLDAPAARPPRMPVEAALLDEVDRCADREQVVDLVLRVLQRRLTTPARIGRRMGDRPRLRHRALVKDLVAALMDGVHSPLERRYRDGVERAHGLPVGERNTRETIDGRPGYRDVRYRRYRMIVELDGAEAHRAAAAWRDRWRDNDAALTEERTFRYGWREIVGRPCAVARQVGAGLRRGGWTGVVRRCGPSCTA